MNTTDASYTAAPACELLATSCACCGRALLDAVSVERGVGPDCAEKYGVTEAQSPADWTAFAAIIAGILDASAVEAFEGNAHRAANALVRLYAVRNRERAAWVPAAVHALGFRTLADRLADRCPALARVEVRPVGSDYAVTAPYSEAFRAAWVPGRRWDRALKVWTVPATSKRALWTAIRGAFGGMVLETPAGRSLIAA